MRITGEDCAAYSTTIAKSEQRSNNGEKNVPLFVRVDALVMCPCLPAIDLAAINPPVLWFEVAVDNHWNFQRFHDAMAGFQIRLAVKLGRSLATVYG